MIPRTATTLQYPKWQKLLAEGVADPKELLALLELETALADEGVFAARQFPLRVPRGFVARMQKGNIDDPLLKQVLPLAIEMQPAAGFIKDPLAESRTNVLPGLLHKYHGRVLLTVAGSCAINCRYCFRRHFPYAQNNVGRKGWDKVLAYLANDPSITEVIYSGGDPLLISDKAFIELSEQIAAIPHIKCLRIHSRIPIVLPERITETLVTWLAQFPLQKVLVVHCNHGNEIDANVINAMRQLQQAGVTLLNQSVLLKGVNDSAASLIALSEQLFTAGILPYYLHFLDKVAGSAHFDVDQEHARQLITQISQHLPGYLVPKLVQEVPEALSKVAL